MLEQIICDADLDYLGREDAAAVAATLFQKLKTRGEVTEELAWNQIQIDFLQSHQYHTSFAKQYRQEQKEAYLKSLG